MLKSTAVTVDDFIDARRTSRFQLMVAVQCAFIVLLDGFDTQAIGYVAPAIVGAWHIDRAALAPVFASGLVGLMIGALTLGPAADRVGRRPVLLFCTLFFGLCSLLTPLAGSVSSLLLVRFVTGLGLGGAMPNAIALTAEYTPQRTRATAVMVMFCGFSLGAAIGGFAAAGLIERYGWPSVFIVGGAIPCVLFALMFARLPESVRYLVLCGGREPDVARIVAAIDPAASRDGTAPDAFAVDARAGGAFLVRQLFTDGRARVTMALWVVFFMSLLDLYFVSNWMPTLMHDAGTPLRRAVIITAMFQFGGTAGTLLLGRVLDRLPPFRVLAVTYFVASLTLVLVAGAGASLVLLTSAIFAAGFCIIGGQIGANALTAGCYPTAIRATGVGWALGVGRIGSIVGPSIGGLLLSFGWGSKPLLMLSAAPALVAAMAALSIDLFRRPRQS